MISLFDDDFVGPGNANFTSPFVYHQNLVAASALAEKNSGPGSDAFDPHNALRDEDAADFTDEINAFEVPDLDTLLPSALIAKYDLDEEGDGSAEDVDDVPDHYLNPVLDPDAQDEENPF